MTSWAKTAWVYEKAAIATLCSRCDYPIKVGEPVVKVPGLYARGYAHIGCVPHNHIRHRDGSS